MASMPHEALMKHGIRTPRMVSFDESKARETSFPAFSLSFDIMENHYFLQNTNNNYKILHYIGFTTSEGVGREHGHWMASPNSRDLFWEVKKGKRVKNKSEPSIAE